jgi:hypothetical protein
VDVHRGKIWRDQDGWWRYRCLNCDYGAGLVTNGDGASIAFPWLVGMAVGHAAPSHWSRRRFS